MTSQSVQTKCENENLKFSCRIPYDPTDYKAQFEVRWLVDGKPLLALRTGQPIKQTRSNGERLIKLDGFNLVGNMGKRVSKDVEFQYGVYTHDTLN